MVVFGSPKGYRGSYNLQTLGKHWEEGNISPQVVFEILFPGNTTTEMAKRLWADQAEQWAECLAEHLWAMGINPDDS